MSSVDANYISQDKYAIWWIVYIHTSNTSLFVEFARSLSLRMINMNNNNNQGDGGGGHRALDGG